jgi:hypothetical protein
MILGDAPEQSLVWEATVTGERIEGAGACLKCGLDDEERSETDPDPKYILLI